MHNIEWKSANSFTNVPNIKPHRNYKKMTVRMSPTLKSLPTIYLCCQPSILTPLNWKLLKLSRKMGICVLGYSTKLLLVNPYQANLTKSLLCLCKQPFRKIEKTHQDETMVTMISHYITLTCSVHLKASVFIASSTSKAWSQFEELSH